jgi:hypothetical protein
MTPTTVAVVLTGPARGGLAAVRGVVGPMTQDAAHTYLDDLADAQAAGTVPADLRARIVPVIDPAGLPTAA